MTSHLPYHDKSSRWSSHSQIVAMLAKLPDRSRVLDVGTATGMLARMSRRDSLDFYGVEANSEWADAASPFYKEIVVRPIEEAGDDFLHGFQAVVLGDILEHLPAPDSVLRRLTGLQPSGALFVISVPNIANFWVRLNLLFGRFDYSDRGILDRTHLRFFTRKTLIQMVKDAGLDVVSIRVTPIPLELVSSIFLTSPGRILHGFFAWLTFLFPTLLGYQFIVEARKP